MIKFFVKGFIGIITASLVFGLNSAFDGKNLPKTQTKQNVEQQETTIEDVQKEIVEEQIQEEIVENQEEQQIEQSFSDSKNETIKQTSTSEVNNQQVTTETLNEQVVHVETNNQPKQNESTNFYDSITHGKHDKDSEPDCKAYSKKIEIKELNDALDWNEANPDNPKQPIIKYSRCYPVVIGGKTLWYAHFFTTEGEEMDDYLKEKYVIN